MKPDVPRAIATVAKLLRDSGEWRTFYRRCCEAGALRLRCQAPRFCAEIREQGVNLPLSDVEDALMVVARKVLPGTPAALWSPDWAQELCQDALARLQERHAGLSPDEREALDLSTKDGREDRMLRAGRSNDPPAFRAALREWERLVLEALEAAKAATKSGAA